MHLYCNEMILDDLRLNHEVHEHYDIQNEASRVPHHFPHSMQLGNHAILSSGMWITSCPVTSPDADLQMKWNQCFTSCLLSASSLM